MSGFDKFLSTATLLLFLSLVPLAVVIPFLLQLLGSGVLLDWTFFSAFPLWVKVLSGVGVFVFLVFELFLLCSSGEKKDQRGKDGNPQP